MVFSIVEQALSSTLLNTVNLRSQHLTTRHDSMVTTVLDGQACGVFSMDATLFPDHLQKIILS
jgi:hypothetical protein